MVTGVVGKASAYETYACDANYSWANFKQFLGSHANCSELQISKRTSLLMRKYIACIAVVVQRLNNGDHSPQVVGSNPDDIAMEISLLKDREHVMGPIWAYH